MRSNHSMIRQGVFAVGLIWLSGSLTTEAVAAPAFLPVPPLDGPSYESGVRDLSDDGLVTAGFSDSDDGVRATRWTFAGESVALGSWFMPQPGDRHSEANAISGDGDTVVGWSRVDSSSTPQFPDRRIAFYWTEATGFQVFPVSAGSEAYAVDVSGDGSVIVGDQRSSSISSWSVRFNIGGSPSPVGLPGSSPWVTSRVSALSADGSRIIGGAFYVSYGGTHVGYRTNPLQLIGTTTNGDQVFSDAITPDGSLVVGHSTAGALPHEKNIFRWTDTGGFDDLGVYAPALNTFMRAVDATGDTLVGEAGAGGSWEALLWRTGSGFEPLQDFAAGELGLDLTGWTLTRANAITPDGNAIGGEGINPDGVAQGWVLYLDAPSLQEVPLLGPLGAVALPLGVLTIGLLSTHRLANRQR